jgi:excisionase family DNA binding protein
LGLSRAVHICSGAAAPYWCSWVKAVISRQSIAGIGIALTVRGSLSNFMENTGENIQLLTLDEAATLLQVSKRTLQRMIKVRELPAFKVGGQWRLRETQLRQWVEHREIARGDSEKGRSDV